MNALTRISAALGLREAAPGTLTRRAPAAMRPIPSTWDPEARTFDATLATGTAVERQDTRGVFDEVLDITAATLPGRVPLLDSHARDSVDRVIGHVSALQVVNGELVGTVTLSRHNPQAVRLAAEISDGHSFGVSIGYAVGTWTDRTNANTKRRERVATAWTLLEASLVPVAADASAGMRQGTEPMPPATATATPPAPGSRAAANAEIRALATTAGLTREWADGQVDAEATPDSARAAAFEAMRTRSAPASRVSALHVATHDDPAARVRAMGEALFTRITPSHRPSDQARAYVGLSIPELARESLRLSGESTTGLSGATVIERSLNGLHTVSDFSLALGDAVGRVLRASYAATPSALRPLARQTTAVDFRSRASVRLAGGLGLERVNEHGEFKSGTLFEAGESYRVETFGKIIGLTRQVLVNDNLGAFAEVPRMLGVAAANFESGALADLVTANPVMADAKTVFHADHGNVGTPAPITLASLSEARIAMRRQKDEGGEVVGGVPRYLVVSPERETEALQAIAEIAAATAAGVNVFAGQLVVIVEPRLAAGAWYLVADPATGPGLEFAHLEGEQPQIISEPGFVIDGIRWRVRLDFGSGWLDWRAWVRNAGA